MLFNPLEIESQQTPLTHEMINNLNNFHTSSY
jgi:hypothetical protein